MAKKVFIAASSQHVGKTTSTLGIVAALQEKGYKVGYCKPVGQKAQTFHGLFADKDAHLFSTFMHFLLNPDLHSPVILGKGATTAYLDAPQNFDYKQRLLHAAEQLEAMNDVVVYEGTGHPGVGSIVGLSNADVAKLLNVPVVLVTVGGIGSTIDELNMNHALFREQNVPLAGVIINKTMPDKIEKVEHYVGKWLHQKGIPLIGVLPYDDTLANPTMDIICEAVRGVVLANEQSLDNRVEHVISGSLIEAHDFEVKPNTLIIVNFRRLDNSFELVRQAAKRAGYNNSGVAGVILHGDPAALSTLNISDLNCFKCIQEEGIPLISTTLDTYGSAVKISHLEVKINTRTPWKIQRAIELIRKNINIEAILGD